MKFQGNVKLSVSCLLLANLCVGSLLWAAEPPRPVDEPAWRTEPMPTARRRVAVRSEWEEIAEGLLLSGTREDPVWYRLLHEKLELGVRRTDYTLGTTTHGGAVDEDRFLGTINQLADEQDHSLNKFFVRYFVIPWIGIEFTTDEVRARTFTSEDGHSDGVFVADGQFLTVVGRATLEEILRLGDWAVHKGEWPAEDKYAWAKRVRPYVGFGTGDFSIDFEEDPWWGLGYPDEESWTRAGSPTTRPANEGRRRSIEAEDSSGDVTVVGCSIYLAEYVFIDIYRRDTSVDTVALYTLSSPPRREESNIPLDNEVFGLGIGVGF